MGFDSGGLVYEVPPLEPLVSLLTYDQAEWWCHNIANRPYVYAVCRPNGLPFYIGKGRGQRMLAHAAFLRGVPLLPDCIAENARANEILALARAGEFERYAVLAECNTDRTALAIEMAQIQRWKIRPRGPLLNATINERAMPMILPPQPHMSAPDIDAVPWAIHPIINRRYTAGYLLRFCPSCHHRCRIPIARNVHSLRCPHCCYSFPTDGPANLAAYLAATQNSA